MTAQEKKLEWHIAFFAFNIPEEHYVRDEHYCCAKVGGNAPEGLRTLSQKIPTFSHFLAGRPTDRLTCISYKLEASTRKSAIDEALFRVNMLLDGFCIIKEVEAPPLAPVILVRENRGPDLEAYLVRDSGWAHHHSREATEKLIWKEHEQKVLNLMLPFFDIASGISPHQKSEIALQIQHSAKGFRAGVCSETFGIEFLCKFAALEGLVCGSMRGRKEVLLKERLGQLFRGRTEIPAMISKLWRRRSNAIHKGELFEHKLLPDSYPLQVRVDDIHYLFTGSLVFVLSNLDAGSMENLWAKASSYELPDWLLKPNPSHTHRIAMTLFIEDSKQVWTGMGVVMDQFFPASNSLIETPS